MNGGTEMDVREKLIELLKQIKYVSVENAANILIANGVTVQDRKQLEAFLHPVDAYKGLKAKYLVFKADTGESVENCFVLRPDKDTASIVALRAYASATDNETLAKDIYNWVGKGATVQEWISVKERLPEKDGQYLIFTTKYFTPDHIDEIDHIDGTEISVYSKRFGFLSKNGLHAKYWCELPQPTKGE